MKQGKKTKSNKNKLHRKIKKLMARLGLIFGTSTLLLSAGKQITNHESENKDKEIVADTENTVPDANVFTDELQKNINNEIVEKDESEKISEEIKNLETPEDVLKYLKNMYIEQYENQTGDTSLTTDDIKINISNHSPDYVYLTGIGYVELHGDNPYETEKKLNDAGIDYDAISDGLGTPITIVDKNGKVIDGAINITDESFKSTPHIIGEKSLGIIADHYEVYSSITDLHRTLSDPTNNEYMTKLAEEAIIEAQKAEKETPEENQMR